MASKLNCEVVLYYNTSIVETDNFKLDSLTAYLIQKHQTLIESVMLEKSVFDSMDISVKLALEPSTLADSGELHGIDYMKITMKNASQESVS